MGRARRRVKDLMTHVEGLVRTKAMAEPGWLEAMRTAPPPIPFRRDHKGVKKLVFPTDRLANIFIKREKDVEPFPDTAYEFAMEQIDLIEKKGMSEKESYEELIPKYRKIMRDDFLSKFEAARGKIILPHTDTEKAFLKEMEELVSSGKSRADAFAEVKKKYVEQRDTLNTIVDELVNVQRHHQIDARKIVEDEHGAIIDDMFLDECERLEGRTYVPLEDREDIFSDWIAEEEAALAEGARMENEQREKDLEYTRMASN